MLAAEGDTSERMDNFLMPCGVGEVRDSKVRKEWSEILSKPGSFTLPNCTRASK